MPKPKLEQYKQSHAYLVIGDCDVAEIKENMKVSPGDDYFLEGETTRIEDLRELIRWLSLKPSSGGIKLVVIQDIDKIAAESINTILKTLEEPPAYAKIILTTHNEQKILPTIQSRCQKIRLLTEPKNLLLEEYSPSAIQTKNIKERFEIASRISELPRPELEDILTNWQLYYREKLIADEDTLSHLNAISRAKDLTATNISVKLLIENLLLEM